MFEVDQLKIKIINENEFPHTIQVLRKGLLDQVAPGFVIGLWQKKKPDEFQLYALGNSKLGEEEYQNESMQIDKFFDIASITKIFATAPLVAVCIERGLFSWDSLIQEFFPEYLFQGIQIRHLLSHTAGFVAWEPFWKKLKDHFFSKPLYSFSILKRQQMMKNLILNEKPILSPGEKKIYSDISFILLGFILEQAFQLPLDDAVKRYLWGPMGIRRAFYKRVDTSVIESVNKDVVATENCYWRGGVLQGQVHDDNCWAMGGYAGHTGAFARVQDLLHYARVLTLTKFFSNSVLKTMLNLGWDAPSGEYPAVGQMFSTHHCVGHLGYTGTSFWIDLDEGVAVVLFSNRVHSLEFHGRQNEKIKSFRPVFHDAIFVDLGLTV